MCLCMCHIAVGLKDLRCGQAYRFASLGLEDRWTWHQGFTEVVVVIGTFKGVSDGRPAWSLWSDLYLNMIPHLNWQQQIFKSA